MYNDNHLKLNISRTKELERKYSSTVFTYLHIYLYTFIYIEIYTQHTIYTYIHSTQYIHIHTKHTAVLSSKRSNDGSSLSSIYYWEVATCHGPLVGCRAGETCDTDAVGPSSQVRARQGTRIVHRNRSLKLRHSRLWVTRLHHTCLQVRSLHRCCALCCHMQPLGLWSSLGHRCSCCNTNKKH